MTRIRNNNGKAIVVIAIVVLFLAIAFFVAAMFISSTRDPIKGMQQVDLETYCKSWIDTQEIVQNGSKSGLHLKGWAYDLASQEPVSQVYIRSGDKTVKCVMNSRPDVANHYSLQSKSDTYGYNGILSNKTDMANTELIFILPGNNTYCVRPIE